MSAVLVFNRWTSHQGANILLGVLRQDGAGSVGFWVISALHVFIAVIFWIKSINTPSPTHVSADLGFHSVESEVRGNKVNRKECFYFVPVLSFIPAVLTSLVDPVWTAPTKATLWSELLNMCEKQVADLRGFFVQTLGQRAIIESICVIFSKVNAGEKCKAVQVKRKTKKVLFKAFFDNFANRIGFGPALVLASEFLSGYLPRCKAGTLKP